jgi:hypothetical protein
MFMQNAVRTLTAAAGEAARMLRPGDTIACPVPRGATQARVHRPDGRDDVVDVSQCLQAVYGRTDVVGLYRIEFDDDASTTLGYAVNLLDRTESLIAPNDRLAVGSDVLAARQGVERINQPLWPYAVAAALLFLLVEWWIYNRRVMI